MDSLKRTYNTLRHSRFMRVAFFGGAAVIVQTIIFEILGIWLKVLHPALATLVGAECGVFTSFFLNNRYSFGGQTQGSLWTRLLRFHMVVSGSLLIQWVCVFSAESLSNSLLIWHIAYATGIVLGFFSNYTGYRLFVWRHHPAV